MNRIAILFMLLLSVNFIDAQKVQVQQMKGAVQFSSNGKSGWSTCQVNKSVSGYLKLDEGASIIFGANGKSMFWKKKGIYKTSELEKQLIGYNSDAAHVLWEQVTHHDEPKRNAIGGVSRGELFDNSLPMDSAFVSVNRPVKFSFENPNGLKFKLYLKSISEASTLDTTFKTKSDFYSFIFFTEGEYLWGITDAESPSPQVWKHLLAVSQENYQFEFKRYESFIQAIADLEDALQKELIQEFLFESKILLP
jgi:hypothetical protein